MARYATARRIDTPRKLEAFSADGYAFDAAASLPDRMVFRRQDGNNEHDTDTADHAAAAAVDCRAGPGRPWGRGRSQVHACVRLDRGRGDRGHGEHAQGHLEQKAQSKPAGRGAGARPAAGRCAALPGCRRPPGLRAAGDAQPARGGVRRPPVRRGVRGPDRTGEAAPGPLPHRGDQDRRGRGQCRPHQQRHVLPARRERAGEAHRGAHRAAAQLARGKRRRAAGAALPPGHGIQARTTTTSIPSSPVRRRSSSAGGSVSAR